VLKGIKNISLANIISKETSGLGLLTVIFKGEDKFKIEGIREEAGHVQDQYKNFVISLLSLNKYMVDSGAGKAKLDGRELAKRMEDYFNSYNTYTEGLMKLRETVEEYTINTKSDYAMAAIDAALTIATVVGVGALVGAGMKAAGGLALKEGAEISAKALAKAVAKNAFKSAINRNALVINVFASSATAGTEVWNQVEMNDAMKKFGENPREGIRSMDAFLSGVESGIAKAGNKNKEEIAKMIKEERIQLNDMAAKLDEPGQKINFWDAAKMFAMTFAVSILIETGLGAAGTAKGLFKAKAPRAKAEPRIEVPAEKATKSKIASLTTQIESGKKAVSNAHVERAKAYLTIGKPEKAMEDLTAAIAKHPGNESAYAARTELRGAQGDIAGAEADAKVYSNYKAAAKTVEQAKSVMGINSTEAIDLLNQAKALNPYSLDAYYYSGSAKFITGDATAGRIDLLRYREIVNSYGLKDKYGVLDPTPGVSIAERLKHVRNQMEHKSESWLWKALNGDIEASERDIVERLTKTKVVGDVAMYKMANEGIEATAMAFDGGKTWLKNGISFELGDASLKIYSKAIVDVVKRTSSMLKGSDISISTIRTGGDEIVVLLTGKGSAAIGNMIEKDVKKEIGTAVAADYNMVPKEMEGIMGAHTCHKTDFTIKLSKKNKLFVEREGRQTTPRQPLNEVETEGVRERISSKSSGILSPLLKLKPEPGTRVIRDTPDGYIGGDVMTFRLNFKDEVKGAFAEVAETEGKALTAATRNEVGPSLTNMIGHSVTDGFESIYEKRLAEFFRNRGISEIEIFKEGAMTFRVNGGEGRIPQAILSDAADYAAAGLIEQTEKYGVTGCKNFISNSKDRLGLDIAGSLSSETLGKADVEIANRALALIRLDRKHMDYALSGDCPANVRELFGRDMPMWVRSYPELKQYLQGNGISDVNIHKLKGWLNIDNLDLERTEWYLFGELRPY
jgi:tetratricopeptide (TPR) repeat protein